MNFRENAKIEPRKAESFREILFALVFIVCVLLLAFPLFGQTKTKAGKAPDLSRFVWPQPPQPARVRYVGQISSVEDVLGKQSKRGWMDRLAGVQKDEPQTRLQKPYGIGVDSRGRIFVADGANRLVFVFDLAKKSVDYRGHRSPARVALPVGIAVDDQDRLFVSDSFFHRITCFSPEGELLAVFGGDELQRPGGIAVDSQRHRLYVADAKAHRVAVFNTNSFTLIQFFGAPSPRGESEEGKFSAPTNVAVDAQGYLYVTDTWNYRVQVFDPQGKFARAFGEQGVLPGYFLRPKGIAVDGEGNIYVTDAEFNNFQILTPAGRPLLAIGGYGTDPGQFILIAGVAVDKNNRIYTTQQFSARVQIFEYVPERTASTKPGTSP